jgi:hypothetical protein
MAAENDAEVDDELAQRIDCLPSTKATTRFKN